MTALLFAARLLVHAATLERWTDLVLTSPQQTCFVSADISIFMHSKGNTDVYEPP